MCTRISIAALIHDSKKLVSDGIIIQWKRSDGIIMQWNATQH